MRSPTRMCGPGNPRRSLASRRSCRRFQPGTNERCVFATVTGNDGLKAEGEAQQDKADAQRDAAKKEAEADAARGGAKAAEKRQEAHQN